MTVGLEVTLVHELTHALQDQHFDLDRLERPRRSTPAPPPPSGPGRGRRPPGRGRLHRGRAHRRASRPPTTRSTPRSWPTARRPPATCPPFIEASFGAPYALGQPFVTMLLNRDGNDGVDEAFEEPPDTEEHLFDPASFLDDEERRGRSSSASTTTTRCSTRGPSAPRAGTSFLAERIDPEGRLRGRARAGTATPSRPSSDDGAACVRAAFVGDTAADEDEMAAALDDVGRPPCPAGAAEVDRGRRPPRARGLRPRRGRRPRAHRPLRDVAVPPQPLGLPRRRRRRRCSTPTAARCYAQTVVDDLDLRGDHRPRRRGLRGRGVPADA